MMASIAAIIFDLGGTLVDWPDWDTAADERWVIAYDYYWSQRNADDRPERSSFVLAMRAAEVAHWERVEKECWSGPPSALVADGFARLNKHASEDEIIATLDGYARATAGRAKAFPDSRETLLVLRSRGYRLGLLSNTWWAAEWHNADLAAHGLDVFLDAAVYTSDLPHSKPHPAVFQEIAARLGVQAAACVIVGDRPVDDIKGGLGAGMRAVLKTNGHARPLPPGVEPTAIIETLAELPPLLEQLVSAAPSATG
jgi:putative hydrolase of the HAD superfamily